MNKLIASKIGIKEGLFSILIGIIILYLIPIPFLIYDGIKAFIWFTQLDLYNWVYILNWIFFFFLLGYFFGKKAGIEILIRNKQPLKVGIKYGILTIFLGSFLGSILGFLSEGIDNIGTNDNPFEDYFFKPMYWINLFGIIPAVLVGIRMGKRIKKRGENYFESK